MSVSNLARRVKLPVGAPTIYAWHVERGAVIATLCDRLGVTYSSGEASAEPPLVGLAGPPGSGKSIAASMIIAQEDIREHFFKGVVWLPVGPGAKDRLRVLMYRLADMIYETTLGLKGRSPQTPDIGVDAEDGATYIREVVGIDSRRLLIVADDVWEVEVLRELRSTGASVLYTTRSEHISIEFPPLRLDAVSHHEAETVLRRAAEVDGKDPLPKMAYYIIERCGPSIMDLVYVGRWSAVRKRVDREAWQNHINRIFDAQRGVEDRTIPLVLWRTGLLRAGLDELACDGDQTRALYLSLAVIPKRVIFRLEDAVALLHDGTCDLEDLEKVRRIMATFERMAIVARQVGGLYRMHDVQADFVRTVITDYPSTHDTAHAHWVKHVSTAKALFAWPLDALVDIWRSVERSREGVETTPYDTALQKIDVSDPRLPKVLRRVAYFYWLAGYHDAACATWVKLLAIEGSIRVNDEFPNLARTQFELGLYQKNAGRINEAGAWFRQALLVQEERLGSDHPDVADTLHHLACCSSTMGRTQDAEQLYRRALVMREARLGSNHPDVASTLYGLALCTLNMGRSEEAVEHFSRALIVYEDKHGADHSQVARTLYELGRCACLSNNEEEAERLFRRALAIQERGKPVSFSALGNTLYQLGGCVSKAGRTEEAEGFYQRSLAIHESASSIDHDNISRTVYALGKCKYKLGRTDEAEELCRQALVMVEESIGRNHPASADILYTLGVYAMNAERRDGAVDLLSQALAIYEEHLGKVHSKVSHTLCNLGRCALRSNLAKEAEMLFSRALVIEERNLGGDHPEVATILYALGNCASKSGDMKAAEDMYRRALAIREICLGINHRDVADTLHAIGKCAKFAGRTAEAAKFYQRALDILKGELPSEHADLSEVQHGLASCRVAVILSE